MGSASAIGQGKRVPTRANVCKVWRRSHGRNANWRRRRRRPTHCRPVVASASRSPLAAWPRAKQQLERRAKVSPFELPLSPLGRGLQTSGRGQIEEKAELVGGVRLSSPRSDGGRPAGCSSCCIACHDFLLLLLLLWLWNRRGEPASGWRFRS